MFSIRLKCTEFVLVSFLLGAPSFSSAAIIVSGTCPPISTNRLVADYICDGNLTITAPTNLILKGGTLIDIRSGDLLIEAGASIIVEPLSQSISIRAANISIAGDIDATGAGSIHGAGPAPGTANNSGYYGGGGGNAGSGGNGWSGSGSGNGVGVGGAGNQGLSSGPTTLGSGGGTNDGGRS